MSTTDKKLWRVEVERVEWCSYYIKADSREAAQEIAGAQTGGLEYERNDPEIHVGHEPWHRATDDVYDPDEGWMGALQYNRRADTVSS